MAETVGFEPTEDCSSAVFKTAALNQTRPRFHVVPFPTVHGTSSLFDRLNPRIFTNAIVVLNVNRIAPRGGDYIATHLVN